MLTLIYDNQKRLSLQPLTEPTLDMSVSVGVSGTTSRVLIGDRLYAPTPLRINCSVVGDLFYNINHYINLVKAIKLATQIQADVGGVVYYRNLLYGGGFRPRGSSLAPRFVYELVLVPAEPWWRDTSGRRAFIWW